MRRFYLGIAGLWALSSAAAECVVSFAEWFTGPQQAVNHTSFTAGPVTFHNSFTDWGNGFTSWAGFAFSTFTNTAEASFANQYAAAQTHPTAYAVGYHDAWNPAPQITFALPAAPRSVRVNNTAWTAGVIRHGNAFARAFTNGDFYVLTLTACSRSGRPLAATNHYLADFRNDRAFLQTNWTRLDLSWMPPETATLIFTVETTDVGPWGPNTPTYFALADFAYAYGGLDSGIAATHPTILCWADGVAAYHPGPNVDAPWQIATHALGPASPNEGLNRSTNVVSLGDNGSITLTFPVPITDGPGADFAVFENAFTEDFLELAYVEVSSDGTNFFRFPSHTLLAEPVDAYAETNQTATRAYAGLAGKHLQGSGTPFDLGELAGSAGLNPRRVTHVRIVDILGNGSNLDSYGNPIYDPTPTFGSGGFDLDAVGVLNPLLQISPHPDTPAPPLPGFTPLLEYTPTLTPPAWTTNAPLPRTNGFYRYRFVK